MKTVKSKVKGRTELVPKMWEKTKGRGHGATSLFFFFKGLIISRAIGCDVNIWKAVEVVDVFMGHIYSLVTK